MDGRALRDGVAHAHGAALVHEALQVVVEPQELAARAERAVERAERLDVVVVGDAVVLEVAHAGELGAVGGQRHVDAVAVVAGRADALQIVEVEAVADDAGVVVAEAARGQDDGAGLVVHQVAEGVGGVHAVHRARLVVRELQAAVVEADVHAQLKGAGVEGQDVALVGRAVLPPVERVHLALVGAEGVVVDGAGELAALLDGPLQVGGGVLDEVLVIQAVHAPLGLAQLLLHDDRLVHLDALLLLPLGVYTEGALDALAVAAHHRLGLERDDGVAVERGLHRGGQAREARAHHEHVARDDLGDLGGVDDDAGGVDGVDGSVGGGSLLGAGGGGGAVRQRGGGHAGSGTGQGGGGHKRAAGEGEL